MKRKTCKPACYDAFHCIGSACTDTCCAGWEIEIDDTAYARYMQLEGPLKARLLAQIGTEGESHYFRLQEGQRCPFLNPDNLCDIFIEAGEDYLCDICTEHPRFYNWYGGYTEAGLGMCCEEAQRLFLQDPAPIRFLVTEEIEAWEDRHAVPEEEIGQWELPTEAGKGQYAEAETARWENEAEDWEEDPLLEVLLALRERLFLLIQDRREPIWQRIHRVCQVAEETKRLIQETPETELDIVLAQFVRQMPDQGGETLEERRERASQEAAGHRDADWCAETVQLDRFLQQMAGGQPVSEWLKDLIAVFLDMEILDANWPACLRKVQETMQEIWEDRQAFLKAYAERCYEYEHLMVYFLYRYFLESVYQLDVCAAVDFAWISILVIFVCDIGYWRAHGALPFKEQCAIIRMYSKEIEYCPENVETLCRYAKQMCKERLEEGKD